VVFSDTPNSSTNKTYHHDIIEIMFKMVLNTINLSLIFQNITVTQNTPP
jgi:hypothetical protein